MEWRAGRTALTVAPARERAHAVPKAKKTAGTPRSSRLFQACAGLQLEAHRPGTSGRERSRSLWNGRLESRSFVAPVIPYLRPRIRSRPFCILMNARPPPR